MTPPVDEPPVSGVRILLVDDEPSNLLALEAILEGPGRQLVRALSGEQALRHLLDSDFAVVLLDLRLPGLDGFETARLTRGRERSRHTPVIFLTAHDGPDFPLAEAYKLGAVDYLVKPLIAEILRAKVAVFVELFEKSRHLRVHAARVRACPAASGPAANQSRGSPPSGTGGHVTVAVRADAEAAWAVLAVKDTGVGIAPEVLPRLFRAFEQADQGPARSSGGLGLGLAVVKQLVGLHHGEVEARSEGRGRGATFTVRLPLEYCRVLMY